MKLRLENDDCMKIMAEYPDKYFDLAVVDPPYGIGINHNIGRRKGDNPSKYKPAYWDNASPEINYFHELFRVSKNQVIWGANHFISKISKDSSCWLLWDKQFSDEVSFSQYEMAYTSFNGMSKKFDKHPSQNDRFHPTQKPIALYSWIFKNYADPEMKILDTHLGSGSSLIAADKFGISEFVGCEIDKEYFEAMMKRYKNYKSQLRLEFAL